MRAPNTRGCHSASNTHLCEVPDLSGVLRPRWQVGPYSVSGKIKAAVYGDNEDDEGSPLFQKLDKLVVLIGKGGFVTAGRTRTSRLAAA